MTPSSALPKEAKKPDTEAPIGPKSETDAHDTAAPAPRTSTSQGETKPAGDELDALLDEYERLTGPKPETPSSPSSEDAPKSPIAQIEDTASMLTRVAEDYAREGEERKSNEEIRSQMG